jgi:hypothetical protein
MIISRSLCIHQCDKCKEKLIDANFSRCGIYLSGEYKHKGFFEYQCPACRNVGAYVIEPAKDDMPGDLFRQFADGVDASYSISQVNTSDFGSL